MEDQLKQLLHQHFKGAMRGFKFVGEIGEKTQNYAPKDCPLNGIDVDGVHFTHKEVILLVNWVEHEESKTKCPFCRKSFTKNL